MSYIQYLGHHSNEGNYKDILREVGESRDHRIEYHEIFPFYLLTSLEIMKPKLIPP